jgi:hypothetical protein
VERLTIRVITGARTCNALFKSLKDKVGASLIIATSPTTTSVDSVDMERSGCESRLLQRKEDPSSFDSPYIEQLASRSERIEEIFVEKNH